MASINKNFVDDLVDDFKALWAGNPDPSELTERIFNQGMPEHLNEQLWQSYLYTLIDIGKLLKDHEWNITSIPQVLENYSRTEEWDYNEVEWVITQESSGEVKADIEDQIPPEEYKELSIAEIDKKTLEAVYEQAEPDLEEYGLHVAGQILTLRDNVTRIIKAHLGDFKYDFYVEFTDLHIESGDVHGNFKGTVEVIVTLTVNELREDPFYAEVVVF